MPGHRLLKFLRAAHLYLGVFTAPALLFFAFTGGLQSFDLHEAARGSDYRPPAWLQAMSLLHKKQSLDVPPRRAPPDALPGKDAGANAAGANREPDSRVLAGSRPDADIASESRRIARTDGAEITSARASDRAAPSRNLLPMKILFALVAGSLFISTLTGLYMASRMSRSARRIAATFAAGIAVPLLLLAI